MTLPCRAFGWIRGVTCAGLVLFMASTSFVMAQSAPTPDPRVKTALEQANLKFTTTSLGNYKLTFEIEGTKRGQLVFVSSRTDKYNDMEIRKVWGVAYKTTKDLTAEMANRLLKDNTIEKLGAWEFGKQDDGFRVKYVVRVPADASPEVLSSAIRATMVTADKMELELTGKDEF